MSLSFHSFSSGELPVELCAKWGVASTMPCARVCVCVSVFGVIVWWSCVFIMSSQLSNEFR